MGFKAKAKNFALKAKAKAKTLALRPSLTCLAVSK